MQETRDPARRRTAIALAILNEGLLVASCLLVLLLAALGCDESCGGSTHWRAMPDAWQWTLLGALGIVLPFTSGLLFVGHLLRRAWVRRAALATQIGAGVGVLVLLSEGQSATELVWLVGAGIALLGLASHRLALEPAELPLVPTDAV